MFGNNHNSSIRNSSSNHGRNETYHRNLLASTRQAGEDGFDTSAFVETIEVDPDPGRESNRHSRRVRVNDVHDVHATEKEDGRWDEDIFVMFGNSKNDKNTSEISNVFDDISFPSDYPSSHIIDVDNDIDVNSDEVDSLAFSESHAGDQDSQSLAYSIESSTLNSLAYSESTRTSINKSTSKKKAGILISELKTELDRKILLASSLVECENDAHSLAYSAADADRENDDDEEDLQSSVKGLDLDMYSLTYSESTKRQQDAVSVKVAEKAWNELDELTRKMHLASSLEHIERPSAVMNGQGNVETISGFPNSSIIAMSSEIPPRLRRKLEAAKRAGKTNTVSLSPSSSPSLHTLPEHEFEDDSNLPPNESPTISKAKEIITRRQKNVSSLSPSSSLERKTASENIGKKESSSVESLLAAAVIIENDQYNDTAPRRQWKPQDDKASEVSSSTHVRFRRNMQFDRVSVFNNDKIRKDGRKNNDNINQRERKVIVSANGSEIVKYGDRL